MIQCTCTIHNCFFVVNYYSPITLQQVQDSPPFYNMPLLDGEHEHDWKIVVIKSGGKK